MVAKCSNPACNREFRELSKGRLFLLPPTHNCYADPAWKVDKLSDYCYWLCPECDVTHTITRGESEVVVSERTSSNPYLDPVPPARPRNKRPARVGWQIQSQAG